MINKRTAANIKRKAKRKKARGTRSWKINWAQIGEAAIFSVKHNKNKKKKGKQNRQWNFTQITTVRKMEFGAMENGKWASGMSNDWDFCGNGAARRRVAYTRKAV